MKTNTNTPTLADFAPALLEALRNITHPSACDEDLQDALALLAEIEAATAPVDLAAYLANCKGDWVWHGSPSYESPEIISSVMDHGGFVEIIFESGAFTRIAHADLTTFIRSGRVNYRRAKCNCGCERVSLAGAHESLAVRSC